MLQSSLQRKQEELKKHALNENCCLGTGKEVSRAFSWCGLASLSAGLADTVNWAWPKCCKCLNFSFTVRLKAYVSGSNGTEPYCSAHDFDEPQVTMTVPFLHHIISESDGTQASHKGGWDIHYVNTPTAYHGHSLSLTPDPALTPPNPCWIFPFSFPLLISPVCPVTFPEPWLLSGQRAPLPGRMKTRGLLIINRIF